MLVIAQGAHLPPPSGGEEGPQSCCHASLPLTPHAAVSRNPLVSSRDLPTLSFVDLLPTDLVPLLPCVPLGEGQQWSREHRPL